MPAPVNHDERRLFVVSVAADLVAERGVAALTVRNVADAAGTSTAIVSHYFADKRHLLLETYRAAAARSTVRFETAASQAGARLEHCLEALLPTDAQRLSDWRLFYAFWGTAATDSELAAEQAVRTRSARRRIQRIIRLQNGTGSPGFQPDDAAAARRLLALVQGIAMQAVFDPDDWTPRRQRSFLRSELGRTSSGNSRT
jgi:AcrR family transcriptional regulator